VAVTEPLDEPVDRLASIPAYRAGQPAPPGAFKLSSNENPFPPLPGVVAAIHDAAADVNRYPDFGSTALVAALARHHAVDAAQIAVSTGSVAVLQAACAAYAGSGDEVVYAWRSFEAYPIVVTVSGATPVAVPLRADERHDLNAMRRAVTDRTRVVVLCSPNNPTGVVIEQVELAAFLDRVPRRVVVVVDEAYAEFVGRPDAAAGLTLLAQHPNLVVLRTFSKAYGLAGLRVGYAVASSSIATAIRKAQTPFGVTTVAERAALASLATQAQMRARVGVITRERVRVISELTAMGLAVTPSQANFVWLRLGRQSVAFAAACEDAGVVVRPFPDEGVRVTVGHVRANERFLGVVRSWLASAD
jgi:histidinol-phosphate aminotransferase